MSVSPHNGQKGWAKEWGSSGEDESRLEGVLICILDSVSKERLIAKVYGSIDYLASRNEARSVGSTEAEARIRRRRATHRGQSALPA